MQPIYAVVGLIVGVLSVLCLSIKPSTINTSLCLSISLYVVHIEHFICLFPQSESGQFSSATIYNCKKFTFTVCLPHENVFILHIFENNQLVQTPAVTIVRENHTTIYLPRLSAWTQFRQTLAFCLLHSSSTADHSSLPATPGNEIQVVSLKRCAKHTITECRVSK